MILGSAVIVAVALYVWLEADAGLARVQAERAALAGRTSPLVTAAGTLGPVYGLVAGVLDSIAGGGAARAAQREALTTLEGRLRGQQTWAAVAGVFGAVALVYGLVQPGPPGWVAALVWSPTIAATAFVGAALAASAYAGRLAPDSAPRSADGVAAPPAAAPAVGAPAAPATPAVRAPAAAPTAASGSLTRRLGRRDTVAVPLRLEAGQSVYLTVRSVRDDDGRPDDSELLVWSPAGALRVDQKFAGERAVAFGAAERGEYRIELHNPSWTSTRSVSLTYRVS